MHLHRPCLQPVINFLRVYPVTISFADFAIQVRFDMCVSNVLHVHDVRFMLLKFSKKQRGPYQSAFDTNPEKRYSKRQNIGIPRLQLDICNVFFALRRNPRIVGPRYLEIAQKQCRNRL